MLELTIAGIIEPGKHAASLRNNAWPLLADIVAKVPKGAAANFPPKNETSDNRQSIGLQMRY
jgi:hypothetical protein